MLIDQMRHLAALAENLKAGLATDGELLSKPELAEALKAAEREFNSHPLRHGASSESVTPQGAKVLAWARSFVSEYEELRRDLRLVEDKKTLAPLLERRSVSPKRLGTPGPTAEQLGLMLSAALRAPDHSALHPWRILEFKQEQRNSLADLFEQEKRRRDPLASVKDLHLAREHATRAPMLLGFVVTPRARSKVPTRERWLAAGAALGNMLNAASFLGFGAIMLSGERCFDPVLKKRLGINPDEFLAGFVSIGTTVEAPPAKAPVNPEEVLCSWIPNNATEIESGLLSERDQ